ncbi:TMEM175 family protein [Sphingomonas sp. LY29]|uniref:TMEM175 family protein n=1 Tax=unclassified Sphingomonas TaxID=196159 RepID=UPI002ADECDEE|nr:MULTISPECIES: TMEM175 family protein [unclassified Sphingomonas]MEA1070949.1 TMEM175 family protein [Sphingomonas sp. LY160]WRP26311.1 TMEM175 family protein [Sphingomonas sp. LY29]
MADPPTSFDAPAHRDDKEGEGAIRGTSRMEAFADGVFAIAFTLPVFNIAFPAIDDGERALETDLWALWPGYWGYLLASLVIGLYWIQHHFSGAIYRTTGHWFLLATVLFLTMIGFIAYPARVLAEFITFPDSRADAAQYWVVALAITSTAWLLKWTVGRVRGQVDTRLDPAYVSRLDRRYKLIAAANVAAAALVYVRWEIGLTLSTVLLASMAWPPETPRYRTESPTVEGE